MSIKILGIETSCDDSSMAVWCDGQILSNVTYNQKIHEKYGGVFPEWASRKHLEAMIPLMKETLDQASCQLTEIDAIAVTQGPGLIGSLLVGIGFAKGLSTGTGKPIITVNHLEAHVMSVLIDEPKPKMPFICLTVSGGHTQLVLVHSIDQLELLGSTIDDAAGEAFDKIGKLLGLPFPAGPHIDKLAKLAEPNFQFPITQLTGYNFSFSGVKTSVLYFLEKQLAQDKDFISKNLNSLCASVQHTITEMLVRQLIRVIDQYNINQVGVAGGVSANSHLRNRLKTVAQEKNLSVYFPQMQYCTDNAAMIAHAGSFKFHKGIFAEKNFEAMARFPIVDSQVS